MSVELVAADRWHEKARHLLGEGWWLLDLCGVDRLSLPEPRERFEVVVQLLSPSTRTRMTLHIPAAGDPPSVPSITDVWPTANFMEREAFDMFGIEFEGHPNLDRILLPDEWEGHPLRKDYGVGKVPVDFIPQPFLQIEGPGQAPNPLEADAPVDDLGQPAGERGEQATPGARP